MITITTLNSESCLRQQLVLNVVILQLQRQMILALLAMASLLAVVTSSFAATCGPATSPGTAPAQWQTYCWIDMTTYNNATVMAGGQAFSVTLSDGSIFAFTLSATTVGATGLVAIAPPSWTGSAVGNTAFLGIPNKPILYTTAGGTVNLTMSNITITPPSGGVSTGIYKIVVADAESSNNGESLTYTTNGGNWTVIDQVDPISGAVYPTISNSGSVFTTTGVAGTVGAYIVGTQSPTTVNLQIVAGGLQGIMFAVQYATITTNKIISGGRANPADQFTFGTKATATGLIISQTTSSGTGLGPFAATVSTVSSSVPITIFEQLAAGSVSNASQYTPSLTCVNTASGSPTVMPTSQPVLNFNIPAIAYGDSIACTFTNTPKPATVALKKITVGAIGGPFTFTRTNLSAAPAAITTTDVNTATPAVPTPLTVTAYNTAVTFTETPAANFTLTAATCTDANSAITGNPASFGSFAGNVITIPAINILAAAQITCTVTNSFNTATAATVAVQKITLGAAGGPFTFTKTNLTSTPAAITTASTNTAYPSVLAPVVVTTVGTAVTITETVATNFTITSASCSDGNAVASGNPAGSFGSLSGTVLTIPATNIRAQAQITCVFTNIVNPAIPVVAIQKTTDVLAGGPFSFTTTNLAGTPAALTTPAPNTPTPPVGSVNFISVTSISTPVTLTETASSNFNLSTATCFDSNAATSGNPASFGSLAGSVVTLPTINLKPFAKIICTFTNTPKLPTFTLQKITAGSTGGPFTFTATNLASAPSSISTSAVGTAAPVAPSVIQVLAGNTQIEITESANPSFAATSASCNDTNSSFTGNPATFGSLSGSVLTVPAANVLPAAQIACSIINTAIPATVALQKLTTGAAGGAFSFAVSNLASTPSSITTSSAGTAAPAAPIPIAISSLNSLVQISENSNLFFTLASVSCSDTNSAVTGNPATFGALTGLLLTIPAANVLPAAQIKCVFTNSGNAPKIKLQKSLSASGRLAAADQFVLSATGTGAPAAITTTGTGSAITSAQMSFTATANSSYTLTESMAAGSASLLTGYAKTVVCLNNNSSGTVVPSTTTIPVNFTIKAADDINCTITNNGAPTPALTITKTFATATIPVNLGQTITYTYTVTNTGNVTMTNVTVTDMHGTPAVLISGGVSTITNDTLTVPGPLGAGASPDTTANNGIWSTLAPGATVQFKYIHTVTQAEIDQG
jgi:uncharacterized repeat protein (TIGR01451 family)